jgi:predicted DNA-binding transcriptional regulator AlpA
MGAQQAASVPFIKKLLSYEELKPVAGIKFTRRHLLNLENEGKFPKRVKVGDRGIGWYEFEIAEFLNGLTETRH